MSRMNTTMLLCIHHLWLGRGQHQTVRGSSKPCSDYLLNSGMDTGVLVVPGSVQRVWCGPAVALLVGPAAVGRLSPAVAGAGLTVVERLAKEGVR